MAAAYRKIELYHYFISLLPLPALSSTAFLKLTRIISTALGAKGQTPASR
jgi:hypothetical protein